MEDNLHLAQMPAADSYSNGGSSTETDGLIAQLPSPDTKRWVVRRKAIVVQAVSNAATKGVLRVSLAAGKESIIRPRTMAARLD